MAIAHGAAQLGEIVFNTDGLSHRLLAFAYSFKRRGECLRRHAVVINEFVTEMRLVAEVQFDRHRFV